MRGFLFPLGPRLALRESALTQRAEVPSSPQTARELLLLPPPVPRCCRIVKSLLGHPRAGFIPRASSVSPRNSPVGEVF